MITTKQVILDNGKGQGAFGVAETWDAAARNARAHWRTNFFAGKPARVRLCERDDGVWRVLVKEAPFTSWGRLAHTIWVQE